MRAGLSWWSLTMVRTLVHIFGWSQPIAEMLGWDFTKTITRGGRGWVVFLSGPHRLSRGRLISALCDCWAAGRCSESCPPPAPLAAEQDQAMSIQNPFWRFLSTFELGKEKTLTAVFPFPFALVTVSSFQRFPEKFEKNPVVCVSTNYAGLKMMSRICFKVTLKILFCTLWHLKWLELCPYTIFRIVGT